MKKQLIICLVLATFILPLVLADNNTASNDTGLNASLGECQEFGDVGLNYSVMGYVRSPWERKYDSISDYCIDDNTIREYFCDGRGEAGGKIGYMDAVCGGLGCREGVCVPSPDNETQVNQTCDNPNPGWRCVMKEIEYSIHEDNNCHIDQDIPCQNGCDHVSGTCRNSESQEVTESTTCTFGNSDEKHNCCFNSRYGGEACCEGIGNCTIDSFGFLNSRLTWKSDCVGQAETLLDGQSEKIFFDCDPNKCTPVGLRQTGQFCGVDNRWSAQKGNSDVCDNNFECGSNLCVDNQCVDSGLFSKIIRWFQNLFGGKKQV